MVCDLLIWHHHDNHFFCFIAPDLYLEFSLSHPVYFLTDCSKAVLLLWILFVICVCLFHTGMSVSCSLMVTCLEKTDLLVLLYVMFSFVFVTFPYGVLLHRFLICLLLTLQIVFNHKMIFSCVLLKYTPGVQ